MTQKLKSKHIVAFLPSLLILFGFIQLFIFKWFIPKYSFLLVAFLISIGVVLCFYLSTRKNKDSVFRVNCMPAIFGISIFLGMIGLAAFVTNLVGKPDQTKGKIVSYYYWSNRCGYRLVLAESNPMGGGFCKAGKSENSYDGIEFVKLQVKVTVLGTLVSSIAPM